MNKKTILTVIIAAAAIGGIMYFTMKKVPAPNEGSTPRENIPNSGIDQSGNIIPDQNVQVNTGVDSLAFDGGANNGNLGGLC